MDRSLERLHEWLAGRSLGVARLTPLAGDVSSRRYVRLRLADGERAVAALYPPELAGACGRFLVSSRLLAAAGIRVPEILAADCDRGLMLLEDVGPRTLYEERPAGRRLAERFELAAAALPRLARLPLDEVEALNPPLDHALLGRELEQTWRHFLAPRGLTGDERLATALRGALDALCRRLGAGAPIPCHRDYMARNLMPCGSGPELAVLDHQDLRPGPRLYDLASLLNDSLFPPPELEERLLRRHAPTPADRLDYHRAAAQRTLKAIGTYALFAARGDDRHLELVPRTLGRALRHLARAPETAALAPELETLWAAETA